MTFLLVRDDSSLVRAAVAEVFYRPSANGRTRRAIARLLPIGVEGESEADDVKEIYVARLQLPQGKHWIVVGTNLIR